MTLRSPFYHFHIYSFSLGFISGFNKFLILAYNHLINIHLIIPQKKKTPKLAQLYQEYIIIFIIKLLGYFWGVTVFHLPQVKTSQPRNMYSIKLRRSLYGLKQYGRMWYNRLSEYLINDGYINNPICPYLFIKKSKLGFAILAVFVDDINLFGTPEELIKAATYLNDEFEMKDLGKTKYCLDLQIEHKSNGILIHQSIYVEKVLKQFNMDKTHLLSSPMIVRSFDVKKDPFHPKEENETLLGPEVPYLSAIGALLYLAQCTRPDIAFSVNLLARFSSTPT